MFQQARHAVLTKIDLLPHLDFDVEQAIGFARQVSPDLRFFRTSSKSREGLQEWYDFLRAQAARSASPRAGDPTREALAVP
jgi:hydrogenase nickel incorporation protein HypB